MLSGAITEMESDTMAVELWYTIDSTAILTDRLIMLKSEYLFLDHCLKVRLGFKLNRIVFMNLKFLQN